MRTRERLGALRISIEDTRERGCEREKKQLRQLLARARAVQGAHNNTIDDGFAQQCHHCCYVVYRRGVCAYGYTHGSGGNVCNVYTRIRNIRAREIYREVPEEFGDLAVRVHTHMPLHDDYNYYAMTHVCVTHSSSTSLLLHEGDTTVYLLYPAYSCLYVCLCVCMYVYTRTYVRTALIVLSSPGSSSGGRERLIYASTYVLSCVARALRRRRRRRESITSRLAVAKVYVHAQPPRVLAAGAYGKR